MDISQEKRMIQRITKKDDPEKKKPKKKLFQIFDLKKPKKNQIKKSYSY